MLNGLPASHGTLKGSQKGNTMPDVETLEKNADDLYKKIYGEANPEDDLNDPLLNLEDELPDEDDEPGDTNLPADDPNKDKKYEELEQKYKAMEGRYHAETERMNTLFSSVFSEKEQLAKQLASLGTPGANTVETTDAELTELQSEYPILYKGFKAMLEKELGEKLKKTEDVVASITSTTNAMQKDSYLSRLDETFPQWRDIKEDPKFTEWLSVQDRYTTLPRMQLLIDADSRQNHIAVANLYQDFAKENGLLSDDGATTTDTTTHIQRQNVSPDTTTGNPNPSLGTNKGFITRAEIGQIYKNRMAGQYSDEEFAKIEAKVFKMTREGKVR